MFWTPIDVSSTCDASSYRPIAVFVLWFLVFTVLFWLIYCSIKPAFVLNADDQVDPGLTILAAAISALIVEIIVLLIKSAIGSRRSRECC